MPVDSRANVSPYEEDGGQGIVARSDAGNMCNRETTDRAGSRPVDPDIAARMASCIKGRTDEALNAQFGISYNTWRKIAANLPIRASLADRIERRLAICHPDPAGRAETRQGCLESRS